MSLSMSDILNIVIGVVFIGLSIPLFIRWRKLSGKVIIADQQWSTMRILFLAIGVLSIITMITQGASMSMFDIFRLTGTIIAVSIYMVVRDGVGEEGMVAGGKLYPWSEVRAYDFEQRKNVVAVYFTVESQNDNKPDDYRTKELDFSNEDEDLLMEFLENNLGRKYTRMKKKTK
jgi:hypothetical protein